MNRNFFLWMLVGVFTLPAFFGFAQAIQDASTGVSFPQNVAFDYQGQQFRLSGTGVATRKKFFVKVYSIASYIEDPSRVEGGNIFQNILDYDKAKQLTFKWLRNASQRRVQDGYRESLEKVTSGSRDEINRFVSFFGNVTKGDTHILRWLPDNTITVMINGRTVGTIKSERFARALWSIWFGENSVVSRNKLVSKIR